jgi:hypothetical protein
MYAQRCSAQQKKRLLELSKNVLTNLAKIGTYAAYFDWFLIRQFLPNEKRPPTDQSLGGGN